MKWNTQLYDSKHSFVSKYGEDLFDLLNAQKGERILDLGCGTGYLADLISQSGAYVTGVDSSLEMIKKARIKYPHIEFDVQSAENFKYDKKFDAIFSNAMLHWVLESKKAVESVCDNLKIGGRFITEFGGKGNINYIISALKKSLIKHGKSTAANKNIWYFPSLSEYAKLLEDNGFRVVQATHFNRDTPLAEKDGIKNWIKMFCKSYLDGISKDLIEQILMDVENEIEITNKKNGKWFADYVRLRIFAIKI